MGDVAWGWLVQLQEPLSVKAGERLLLHVEFIAQEASEAFHIMEIWNRSRMIISYDIFYIKLSSIS